MPSDFELTGVCIACILRQVLEACEEASKDTTLRYQAVRDAVMYLNTAALDELDHVRVGSELHRIVRQRTKNPDPYHELKKVSNQAALDWLSKTSVHGNLSFMDAVSIAAWGNMIDYGAMSTSESPAALIAKAMNTRIDPEQVAQFQDLVERSRRVLYLCDNAGEIVFDKLLVSTIQTLGPNVTVVVRGGPVMNDATIDDARDVEMIMLARTITTGAAVSGIVLEESSQES
jgi:uncharacterized protein with ATP-grasp and redox domains